jgi:hypothetical protein
MAEESLPKAPRRSKRTYKFKFKPLPSDLMGPNEEWRMDESGYYSFSSRGRVFSHKHGRLIGAPQTVGYIQVPGFRRELPHRMVHREVYRLFVGDIPPDLEINHKDGVKSNNAVENLEAVTKSENMRHAYQVLGCRTRAKMTADQVRQLRARYAAGEVLWRLAEELGIDRGTASRIVRGVTWKLLNG